MTQERRQYFRIDDTVELSYRLATEKRPSRKALPADELLIPSAQVLEHIDREMISILDVVWHKDPVIAKVLGLLNRKLDVLSKELNLAPEPNNPAASKGESQQINISGCGMAFRAKERFAPETRLEFTITLRPENISMNLAGHVIQCNALESEADEFKVQIQFTNMTEQTQDLLIQHIVQRQIQNRICRASREQEREG